MLNNNRLSDSSLNTGSSVVLNDNSLDTGGSVALNDNRLDTGGSDVLNDSSLSDGIDGLNLSVDNLGLHLHLSRWEIQRREGGRRRIIKTTVTGAPDTAIGWA